VVPESASVVVMSRPAASYSYVVTLPPAHPSGRVVLCLRPQVPVRLLRLIDPVLIVLDDGHLAAQHVVYVIPIAFV